MRIDPFYVILASLYARVHGAHILVLFNGIICWEYGTFSESETGFPFFFFFYIFQKPRAQQSLFQEVLLQNAFFFFHSEVLTACPYYPCPFWGQPESPGFSFLYSSEMHNTFYWVKKVFCSCSKHFLLSVRKRDTSSGSRSVEVQMLLLMVSSYLISCSSAVAQELTLNTYSVSVSLFSFPITVHFAYFLMYIRILL